MPQPSRTEILVALAGELRRRGPRTVYAVLHVHLPERFCTATATGPRLSRQSPGR
jgi:hypothetical protein